MPTPADIAEYTLSGIVVRMLLDHADSILLGIAKFVMSDNAYGVSSDTVKCM
jgi:hypothetical protein